VDLFNYGSFISGSLVTPPKWESDGRQQLPMAKENHQNVLSVFSWFRFVCPCIKLDKSIFGQSVHVFRNMPKAPLDNAKGQDLPKNRKLITSPDAPKR